MSWYPVDHIIKQIMENEDKAVWFDTKSRKIVKSRGYAKRRRSTVKQNAQVLRHVLRNEEKAYLRQRLNKRKFWLPRRVRRCEMIKRVFKTP